ncbi:uncharacterized protein [Branchiostoma lanceolatum]|uniref:uncharacterized protein n=1 Tax=Branchiostoma lanceolatum TaxID=7740 RepID=UPI0034542E6C
MEKGKLFAAELVFWLAPGQLDRTLMSADIAAFEKQKDLEMKANELPAVELPPVELPVEPRAPLADIVNTQAPATARTTGTRKATKNKNQATPKVPRKKAKKNQKDGDDLRRAQAATVRTKTQQILELSNHEVGIEEETAGQKTAGQETAGQETAGQETAGQETAGKETAGQETAGKETAGQETAGQETAGKETAGKETAGKETAGQETAGQETAGKETAGKETAGKETARQEQETAGKETAGQETAGQEQETAGKETAGKETAGQETAGQETAGKETAGQETAGQETAGKETAGKETAGQETAGKETAGQETAGKETAGQETAGKETAGKETAGKETAGKETAGKETAGKETAGQETFSTEDNTEGEPFSTEDNTDWEPFSTEDSTDWEPFSTEDNTEWEPISTEDSTEWEPSTHDIEEPAITSTPRPSNRHSTHTMAAHSVMCDICGKNVRGTDGLSFHKASAHSIPQTSPSVLNFTNPNSSSLHTPMSSPLPSTPQSVAMPGAPLLSGIGEVGSSTWIKPLSARTGGQSPVPLGGIDHGVIIYPYLLTIKLHKSKTPAAFFKELMALYFTEEELFRGNLMGGGNHEALNPVIIGAILAETKKQWPGVKLNLARVVNEKCCRMRSTFKRRKDRPRFYADLNQRQPGQAVQTIQARRVVQPGQAAPAIQAGGVMQPGQAAPAIQAGRVVQPGQAAPAIQAGRVGQLGMVVGEAMRLLDLS